MDDHRPSNEGIFPLEDLPNLEHVGKPDGVNEVYFVGLDESRPDLASYLTLRFVKGWLPLSRLRADRFDDALDTVELKVSAHEYRQGTLETLRLRSFYTGSTYWLPGWDGSRERAEIWIDDVVELQAANVEDDRRHGRTPWDQ